MSDTATKRSAFPVELKTERRRIKVWRQFRQHHMAILGVILMSLIVLFVFVGSMHFTLEYANDTDLRSRWQAPSAAHPFGTDSVGRDIMARTVFGGQVSLSIAFFAVTVMIGVGVPLGLLAGYFGGWVDSLIMRLVEALLSIPLLFLLLVLSQIFRESVESIDVLGQEMDGSVVVMVLVIGLTGWMSLARIIRANTLSLKEQEFVLSARATGAGHWRILSQHILPNTINPIIIFVSLGISATILLESYVSFLGLGVEPPTPSWGNMLQRAVEKIDSAPWLWFYPGLFTLLTVFSVNFIGDGLRDALDVRN